MNNYKIYLLIIFLIILVFTINLILKKINIKSYLKYLLISFFISYFFVLFNPRTKFLFNMTYLKAIILFISLFFFLFSYGIYKNNLKTYNKNIICYIIFYLILLFSITMVIKRVDMSFKLSNIKYLKGGNLIPFKSIKNYLKSNVLTRTKYLNILGNLVMLTHLSFLLIIKDKKKNVFKEISIIFLTVIGVELLQVLTNTGSFDIDDIILNIAGSIIFILVFKNLVLKIKNIFYQDFNLNDKKKLSLIIITSIIPILFIIEVIIKSIKWGF